MRQFQGLDSKVSVPFTRAAPLPLQTINLRNLLPSGDADAAKFITVEVQRGSSSSGAPNAQRVWVVPTNVLPSDQSNFLNFWRHDLLVDQRYTVTVPVVSGFGQPLFQVAATENATLMPFAITALWGGSGVVREFKGYTTNRMGVVPGWTPNSFDWREVDLTQFVQDEHLGQVEAFILHLYWVAGATEGAAARAVGSTWEQFPAFSDTTGHRTEIVKCTSGHVIEVHDQSTGKNGESPATFYYVVGYLLSGEYDDGTGDKYQLHGVSQEQDLELPLGSFTAVDLTPYTSEQVSGVVWRQLLPENTPSPLQSYARKLGSTSGVQNQVRSVHGSFPLNVVSGQIERYTSASGVLEWFSAWLEFKPPAPPVPPDPCDWFSLTSGEVWQGSAAAPDWYGAKSGPDWKDDKAEPDWKDDKAAGGWFDPQEC